MQPDLLSILTALANSKSGERYHKKGRFSLLDGEYQPPWVLEKNRTSLRKSNSPTLSVLTAVANSEMVRQGEQGFATLGISR
jgi:hypothetical protein